MPLSKRFVLQLFQLSRVALILFVEMLTSHSCFLRISMFRSLLRRPFSTTSARALKHCENHEFLSKNSFLGSWDAPRDPKEAEAKLTRLRREYALQVKEVRKEYIREMEVMKIEKERKDEARREALRVANEERKKLKAQAAQLRAQERDIERQQFRETLVCSSSSFPILVSLDSE